VPPEGPIAPEEDRRPLKFTARTQLVLVPVVVTDKSGAPIPGLTKESFKVLENGKEQPIAVFEEVRPGATKAQRSPRPANEFSNVLSGTEAPKRLTIIALDMVNTPFLDQTRAREQLIRYLAENVEAGSLVSLVTIHRHGIQVIHDFTSDTQSLISALRTVAGRLHLLEGSELAASEAHSEVAGQAGPLTPNTGGDPSPAIHQLMDFAEAKEALADTQFAGYQQASAIAITLESFQHIAQAYAGVPGRKSLIWITGSFPFSIDTDTAGLGGEGPSALYERTLQMMGDANIAVYPVDARGLVVVGLPNASVNLSSRQTLLPYAALEIVHRSQESTITTLQTFAAMTGGRAFYNNNDLTGSFREADQDSAAYYMLGYYLNKKNTRAGWRKLSVKVLQDGVTVRARNGFFVTQATVEPETTRAMDIGVALHSPLDYTGLALSVKWTATEPKGDKRKVGFAVMLPPNAASIDESDGNRLSLEFLAVGRDPKGESAGQFDQAIEAKLKPEAVAQIRSAGVTYNNSILLPPGEYAVRFVVRDNVTGRMGSVLAPIKVE
jgi:VWFA-related protein